MGIDYSSIGGVGIEVTKEIREHLISRGIFTQEDWDEDPIECLDKTGIMYDTGGSYYDSESLSYYFLIDGSTLTEILQNEESFLLKLKSLGIELGRDDLQIISDYCIY